MLDHLGIHVSDLAKSTAFYTKALAPLGYSVVMEFPDYKVCGLGVAPKPDFWIAERSPASAGVHVAFVAASRALVDAFYAAAIAAGGKDNGPPGPRPMYHPGYYGAFVFDPDGNNVEAVCHTGA